MNPIEKLGEQSIVLFLLFYIYNFITFKNNYSLMMFITVTINIFINFYTKLKLIDIMKPYNHKLPILGSFCRPIDRDCKNMTATGYGMPSGHSQVITFIPAIYYFLYKDFETFSFSKFLTMCCISLFVMATRYTSKMHSLQQIIAGSSIGIILAFISAKSLRYLNIF